MKKRFRKIGFGRKHDSPEYRLKLWNRMRKQFLEDFPELQLLLTDDKSLQLGSIIPRYSDLYPKIGESYTLDTIRYLSNHTEINPASTNFVFYLTDMGSHRKFLKNLYYPLLEYDTGDGLEYYTTYQGFYYRDLLVLQWKLATGRFFKKIIPVIGSEISRMDSTKVKLITANMKIGQVIYPKLNSKYILPLDVSNFIYFYMFTNSSIGGPFRKLMRTFRSLMAKKTKVNIIKLLKLTPKKREKLVMSMYVYLWYGRKNYFEISKHIKKRKKPAFYFPQVSKVFQEMQKDYPTLVEPE